MTPGNSTIARLLYAAGLLLTVERSSVVSVGAVSGACGCVESALEIFDLVSNHGLLLREGNFKEEQERRRRYEVTVLQSSSRATEERKRKGGKSEKYVLFYFLYRTRTLTRLLHFLGDIAARYVAIWDYTQASPAELSFHKGDVFKVVENECDA